MSATVQDNPARSRYELELEGGTAFVTYRRSTGVVTLLHAEVPPELEGRGYGSALALGTLEVIRAQGNKVIPQCSFIADYIGRCRLSYFQPLQPGPRTTRPGSAPVCSPLRRTCWPLTKTSTTPVAY